MKVLISLKEMVVLMVPLLVGGVQPNGESAVPHKPELSTEVVLGDDEEQLLDVPGLLVRVNIAESSAG